MDRFLARPAPAASPRRSDGVGFAKSEFPRLESRLDDSRL